MTSFFLVGVKTTIHLFTYSLSGNKTKKWTTFFCSELKHLFTYSPIHLFTYSPIHLFTYSPTYSLFSIRRFRRIEPKGCGSVHFRENWAYATKRRLSSALLQFLTHYRVAICVPHKDPATPLLLSKQCRNSVGAPGCSEPTASVKLVNCPSKK
jgi:hypothetical protein